MGKNSPARYIAIVCVVALSLWIWCSASWAIGTWPPPPYSSSPGPAECWQGSNPGPRGESPSCKGGSPIDQINTFTGNLTVEDMPVYYEGPKGAIPFVVMYNTQSGRTGPLGNRWTHTYNTYIVDSAPYGATLIEGNGREVAFTGTDPYTAPAGVFDVLQKTYSGSTWTGWMVTRRTNEVYYFDTAGRMTSYVNADGLSWSLAYSGSLLTTITDPLGRQTTLQYSSGYLTQVTVPGGLYATFQYDASTPKRLIGITDAAGESYSFGYSGALIININDPSGSQAWYSYGTFNNKMVVTSTGITNVNGSVENYSYSPQGNGQLYVDVTQQKDGASRITRYIYENTNDPANGRYYGTLLAKIVDPGGVAATVAYGYDSHFRMVRMRDSYQPETGGKAHRHFYYYAYSPPDIRAGLVTKYIDPENSDASPSDTGTPTSNCPGYLYQYNTRGNLTKITTPEGRVTDFTYVSGTDRLSSIIVRDQDFNGNAINRTTSFTYWGSGDPIHKRFQLKTVTDARSNITSYDYNANGYLSTITPPVGGTIQLTTNAMGDVTAVNDGNGNTTSYQYDGIHRLTRITYPSVGAGQKYRQFNWHCCGLDTVTDENGRVTKYIYQQYTNRLWKVIENYGGLNYTTEYGYDEVGNVKTVKNARLKTTTYTWDNADRLVRMDYPDSTYETWTLRDDGRIRQHRDGRGRITTYRYDASDRLAGSGAYRAIDYPNDTDVQIVRDKDGLITSFVDAMGTSSIVYYPSTWVKSFTNGAGKMTSYQYNGVGDVSHMRVSPSTDWFAYSYDGRNLLASVTNIDGQTISFTYDNGGRRTRMTRSGGYTDYVYNARNWITAVRNRSSGGVVQYDAEYYYSDGALWDHTGNLLRKVESWLGTGALTTTLRYDNVYRLTEETRRDSGGAVQYSYLYGYDAVGNRTSENRDGVARTYTYDNNDKLTGISGGGQSATLGYDGAGNMTSVSGTMYGSWTLVYDDESRLTSVSYPSGGGSVTDLYNYNALGQRMRARLGGVWYRYVYDGERVVEETDDAGGMLARYTTESGSYYEPLWHIQRSAGESRFPLYDGIGSVRRLVDAGNNHTDMYDLSAFGLERSATVTTPNPYRFGGAWGYLTDPSGMLQLGARFYWPEVGRFVQEDPIGEGMNWYGYAGGNPVRGIDPEGEKWYKPWEWRKRRPDPEQEPCPTGPALMVGGAAIAGAGHLATGIGDAAGKAGQTSGWSVAGKCAKGFGFGMSIVGGIITYYQTKPQAEAAGRAVQNRIIEGCETQEDRDEAGWIYPALGRRMKQP